MKYLFWGLLLSLAFGSKLFAGSQDAIISGSISQMANGDSVKLSINQYGYVDNQPLLGLRIYKCLIVNHHFYFKIAMSSIPLHGELIFGDGRQIPSVAGLVENGDRVAIRKDEQGFHFAGRGSEKFNTIYELRKIYENDFNKYYATEFRPPYGMLNILKRLDTLATDQLFFLNAKKNKLSGDAYTLIQSDILALFYGFPGFVYRNVYAGLKDSLRNKALSTVKNYKRKSLLNSVDSINFNKNKILKYAARYTYSLIEKFRFDSCYLAKQPFIFKNCYGYMSKTYSGALRERIYIDLFYTYRHSTQDMSNSADDALKSIKSKEFIDLLNKIRLTYMNGASAFNFKLTDTSGNVRQLSDYRGKVVVMDFWFTGCGACLKLQPYLQAIEKSFISKPVVFLSINLDKSKKRWLTSIHDRRYTTDGAVNLFTDGLEFKHPLCLKYDLAGHGCPYLMLVDKSGKIMQNPLVLWIDKGKNLSELIQKAIN